MQLALRKADASAAHKANRGVVARAPPDLGVVHDAPKVARERRGEGRRPRLHRIVERGMPLLRAQHGANMVGPTGHKALQVRTLDMQRRARNQWHGVNLADGSVHLRVHPVDTAAINGHGNTAGHVLKARNRHGNAPGKGEGAGRRQQLRRRDKVCPLEGAEAGGVRDRLCRAPNRFQHTCGGVLLQPRGEQGMGDALVIGAFGLGVASLTLGWGAACRNTRHGHNVGIALAELYAVVGHGRGGTDTMIAFAVLAACVWAVGRASPPTTVTVTIVAVAVTFVTGNRDAIALGTGVPVLLCALVPAVYPASAGS